jgi:hypothetical protein
VRSESLRGKRHSVKNITFRMNTNKEHKPYGSSRSIFSARKSQQHIMVRLFVLEMAKKPAGYRKEVWTRKETVYRVERHS